MPALPAERLAALDVHCAGLAQGKKGKYLRLDYLDLRKVIS
jgi:hypothetical protein